jgi:glutathione synthase/RimK-type ligase-like ATP-grasp enzyme
MAEMNSERALVRILREICGERNIKLTSFSGDWVFCLRARERVAYVFGYDFGLNTATAKLISKDKAATSDLLHLHGVPRIEHRIFHGPQLLGFVPMQGNWASILDYFKSCNHDVVCKPIEGTGGAGVFRAQSPLELELAVHKLFANNRSICICPFASLEAEYRVPVLNGNAEFIYQKQRPKVTGDGHRTLLNLIVDQFAGNGNVEALLPVLTGAKERKLDLKSIPKEGESVTLNWRHNLGQGSTPALLRADTQPGIAVVKLAVLAARMLGIALASVDIVAVNGELKVLEINSGIMMESLVRALPQGNQIAKRFYEKIICAVLDLEVSASI